VTRSRWFARIGLGTFGRVPEWFVDLDSRMAYLDLTQTDNLDLEDVERLLLDLLPYYEDKQVTRVVIGVRHTHPPTVTVLIQGVRSQSEAVGVEFSVREVG
jgi:hypothetical protein